MNRLFIIGNGFDCAHGINSKYSDFMQWLKVNDNDLYDKLVEVYDTSILWKDFELALGKPRIDVMNKIDNMFDVKLFGNLWYKNIHDNLKKWLRLINNTYHEKIMGLNSNDFYFTFNYTDTLEVLYEINENNIIHIHGDIAATYFDSECNNIKFGHNNQITSTTHYSLNSTRKDVGKNLIENKQLINNFLDKIDTAVFIGFSYSMIDFPYFSYINEYCRNKIKWIFSFYSDDDLINLNSYINKLGLSPVQYKIIPSFNIINSNY